MPPRASYSPTAVLIPAVACGPFQQPASPSARPPTTGSCPASDHQPRFAADPRAGSHPAAALPGLGQLQLWNFQVISSTFSGIQCAPCPRLLFSRGSKPFPSLPRPNAPRSIGGSAMAPFALGSQVVAVASVSVGLDSSVKGVALKYRATGKGFVVRHIKFAENRVYSRNHFVKVFVIT
ncbi:Callose synthase 10 [Zea mays]|uniref:Callose synthase 10 n=1 Tax=Zea mays TaxID=4577 RepID=A0A3L6FPV5_MAIZE|nr:Callose synthase 10 [Zea mays]